MADIFFAGVNLNKLAGKDPFMADFLADTIHNADYSGLPIDGLTPAEIHQIGIDYRDATHYKKTNLTLAKKYLQAAADMGFTDAWVDLGLEYYNDMIPNYEIALHWFQQAADAGHAGAMLVIGQIFESGNGAEKKPEEAWRWYRKAAEAGSAEAWYRLGEKAFLDRNDVESCNSAIECYRKAANLGHGGAMYALGRMYHSGNGTKQDLEKAAEWLEKAVEAGRGAALELLCEMYNQQEIPKPKYETAAKWLQTVPYGADAAMDLACSYRNLDSENPPPQSDYSKVVFWYEQAAAKGSVGAMNELVRLYSRGGKHSEKSTVPIDMKKAAHWLIKAAETGDAAAMYTYSLWLDPPDGMPCGGVARDKQKSFEWLKKAANAGSADAMYQMGEVFSWDYYGNGLVPQNLTLAREWYAKARDHGNDIAYISVNRIDEELKEG